MKILLHVGTIASTFLTIALIFILTIQFSVTYAKDPQSVQPQEEAESCYDFSVRSQQSYEQAMANLINDVDPFNPRSNFDAETFVPKQLIIGGSAADAETISAALGQRGLGLVSASQAFSVSGQLVQLFDVLKGRETPYHTVRQVLCEIDRLKAAESISITTFAEPNYLISPAPWWAGGSQWRDDETGYGYVSLNDVNQDESLVGSDFKEQWIWSNQGISLTTDSPIGLQRAVSQTGAGIKVAIFDTSPIYDTGKISFTLADGSTPLSLNVVSGAFSQTVAANPANALVDHGPFVASLVHEVAPDAQIDLIPTLDFSRTVDLFTVSTVVNRYVTSEFSRTNSLAGTVLNFSLGVHHPVTRTFSGMTETFGFPSEVLTLKSVLQEAHDAGAVIVAAAGNDFAFGNPESPYMEAPASYDFVIGVGGSAHPGGDGTGRSCFSNNGDVFAPGGNGKDNCNSPPNSIDCENDPTLCVVGLAHTQVFSNGNAGYRGWVGSSFAAPQVSGLAALILGETMGTQRRGAVQPLPEQIREVIECGARKDDVNVISVVGSFSEECLSTIPSQPGEIRFRSAHVSVDEDASVVNIVVERVNGADGPVTVTYATFDGTATPGQDYPASAGDAVFADKQTEATITIPIFDNNTMEPDETFIVRLGSVLAGNGTLVEPLETTVTIVDNDTTPPGVLQFSSATYAVQEDAEMLMLTVERSGGTRDEVTVSYRTENGTAEFARDYTSNLGRLTFADGETVKTLAIEILDDLGDESNETFTVQLEDVVGVATLGPNAVATVTILDNDGAPNPTSVPTSTPEPSSMPTTTPAASATPNPSATPVGTDNGEILYLPLLQN